METDQIWTLGIWRTKPGQEQAFREAWAAFAEWTEANQDGALEAYLLQDPEHPQRFFSFGPWRDAAAVTHWRDSSQFHAFVMTTQSLCEDFQPNALRLVAHAGGR